MREIKPSTAWSVISVATVLAIIGIIYYISPEWGTTAQVHDNHISGESVISPMPIEQSSTTPTSSVAITNITSSTVGILETVSSVGPTSTWNHVNDGVLSYSFPNTWQVTTSSYSYYIKGAETITITSPYIQNFPGRANDEVYYEQYFLYDPAKGVEDNDIIGQFFDYTEIGVDVPTIAVSNNFLANSAEYQIAKIIVSTITPSVQWTPIPPDQDGESTLIGDIVSLHFPSPILYPDSWVSDCVYAGPQATETSGDIYCDVMNQANYMTYDSKNGWQPLPNVCYFEFHGSTEWNAVYAEDGSRTSAGSYKDDSTSTTYDTYLDVSDKQECQQQIDSIQAEFSKNLYYIDGVLDKGISK